MKVFKERLARELTVALVVKVVALGLLWIAFFREAPPADPARLLAPAPSHAESRR